MPTDQLILLAIIAATTLLYIVRWIPPEATSVLAVVALALFGVLEPSDALSGFSSTATLTVGAMFVLSGGLLRTGALEAITVWLAKYSHGSPRRLLLMMGIVIPIASAFVNNTPVVVMMVPVALSLGSQFNIRPSKLLIPISYFAVLGGTITLIGTSTNILVDDLYRSSGGEGFSLFTFAPLGLIYCVVGVGFILLFSERLLPNRAPLVDLISRPNASYVTEIVIGSNSSLVGRVAERVFERIATVDRVTAVPHPRHRRLGKPARIAKAPAVENDSLELLELIRDGTIYRAEETRMLQLHAHDTLLVAGTPKDLTLFIENTGAQLATVLEDDQRTPTQSIDQKVVEAVVLPDSSLNGRLIRTLDLSRLYGLKVLGLQQNGRQLLSGLREMRLQSGHVLLLQGDASALRACSETNKLLLVEGVDGSILRAGKNRQALLIMLGVVLLATFSPIPIVVLALAGAALMVISNCLRPDEALRSLDPATLLLLAAAIPLGLAMQSTGLAQSLVDVLLSGNLASNPVLFLSIFYLLTNLLTQIISNNAAAVLLTPIALSLAASAGIAYTPLLVAIAFGASAAFMTPMGYQTNAIVMGPGGYTFGDYLRIGIPLSVVMWLTATVFIPLFWPL